MPVKPAFGVYEIDKPLILATPNDAGVAREILLVPALVAVVIILLLLFADTSILIGFALGAIPLTVMLIVAAIEVPKALVAVYEKVSVPA